MHKLHIAQHLGQNARREGAGVGVQGDHTDRRKANEQHRLQSGER